MIIDGSNANYGTLKGLETCKTICNVHDECVAFSSVVDDVCGFWETGPLEPYNTSGWACYQKIGAYCSYANKLALVFIS